MPVGPYVISPPVALSALLIISLLPDLIVVFPVKVAPALKVAFCEVSSVKAGVLLVYKVKGSDEDVPTCSRFVLV